MLLFEVCEYLRGACQLVLLAHVIIDRVEFGVPGAALLLLSAQFLGVNLLGELLTEVPKVQADLFIFQIELFNLIFMLFLVLFQPIRGDYGFRGRDNWLKRRCKSSSRDGGLRGRVGRMLIKRQWRLVNLHGRLRSQVGCEIQLQGLNTF